MDTQPNDKPAVAMTCGNCLFHVRANAEQENQPEAVKCTIRAPVAGKYLAKMDATARCTYWTDAETLAQPLRHLAPPSQLVPFVPTFQPETNGAKAEGGAA